jgi:hypothetical protein
MSRRTTWLVVLGVAALLIVLTLKYGVKHTIDGVDVNDQTEKDYVITDAPGGGRDVDSKSGRMKFWLPGYPYRTDQNIDSPHGAVAFHAFSNDGQRISCTASWTERGPADTRTDAEVFEETGSVLATTVDGKVLVTRETSLGRHPGKELQLSAARPRVGSYRVRIYVLGTRIYSLTVFLMPGAEVDPEVDRFFESLAVTENGGLLRVPPSPPEVRPDLKDVYVSMAQESPPGTFRTLLVHEDGVVELVTGRDGPVARRTGKSVADLRALRRLFDGAAWRALPAEPEGGGGAAMYAIASGGRTVHRSDPLAKVEPVFVDAIGALGPLWIYAEEAERPGAAH